MLDVLVTHILKRLEAFPDATFREIELVDISKRLFNQLVKEGFLEFDHYDKDGDSYFSDRIGDSGVERTIRIRNDKITAFSSEADVATLELAKPETTYYRFNLDKLIDQIYTQNKLEEQADITSERMRFVGSKDVAGGRVGVFFALHDSPERLETALLALPNTGNKYARYVVMSPSQQISSQKVLGSLNRLNVSHGLLGTMFSGGFKLKSEVLLGKSKVGIASDLHFPGKITNRKYILKIGLQEAGITEGNFTLLLRMAVSVITTKDGWFETSQMVKENLVTNMMYTGQAIQRLTDDLKRSFTGVSFDAFIESGGKRYRLTIPKDKISFDLDMLKTMKVDSELTKIIKKLSVALKKAEKALSPSKGRK